MTDDYGLFITGATGFVGAALLRHFAAAGYPVTGSGRGAAPEALLRVAGYHRADICRPMMPVRPDTVIHTAALASDTASEQALQMANETGARHVFEATKSASLFVYISSSSVYDSNGSTHLEDESVDLHLLSPYGRSKRKAENWLLEQDWRGRTLVILRPRAVYGKGDRQLLPRLLRLVRGGRIFIPGDMRVQSSLTHVDNLCAATERCIRHFTLHPGGVHIFNVADTTPYEMRLAVSELLSAVCGRKLAFVEMPLAPLRAFAGMMDKWRITTSFTLLSLASVSQNNMLEIKKIAQTIDFQPHLNLWDEIDDIGAWAQQVGLKALRSADPLLPWK